MKLAKIEHRRCDSCEGSTLVWIPDTWTEDDLSAVVDKAMKRTLDTEAVLKHYPEAPIFPGWNPDYKNKPDMLVSEVDTLFDKQKKIWDAYEKQRNLTRKPFSYWLKIEGEGNIQEFYDEEPAVTTTASWGHRHGTAIDYGETDLKSI